MRKPLDNGTGFVCSVAGCDRPAFCRTWCAAHYHRWQRHGSPNGGQVGRTVMLAWLRDHVTWEDRNDCLTWPFRKGPDGRCGSVTLDGKQIVAARFMCILAHGEPPSNKHHAAHNCGKGHLACINPHHLRWASPKENQLDRHLDGTDTRGERNGSARLRRQDVIKIRQLVPLLRGRMSHADIGKLFGISAQSVGDIVRRKVWSWLD